MGAVEIIPYDPGMKEEVAELFRLLVGPGLTEARRHLEWKYEENPYFPEPILYLARANGRLVGMRGLTGARWEAGQGSPPVIMPYPDDHAVVEDHRGSGVATLLMRALLDDASARGFEYLCNLSAGLVTALASLAAGWKKAVAMEPVAVTHTPGTIARLTRKVILQSEKLKRLSRRQGWGPYSADAFMRLDREGQGRGAGTGTITVEASPRVEAMAGLVGRLGHDGRIRHERTPAYLTWRYRQPVHEYRFLYHETAGVLDGYLVVRRYRSVPVYSRHVDIVDWEAVNDQVADALLDRVTAWGRFWQLQSWTGTLPAARVRKLEGSGFVPSDLDRRARGLPGVLVIAPSRRDAPESWLLNGRPLAKAESWDVRQIYSMHG